MLERPRSDLPDPVFNANSVPVAYAAQTQSRTRLPELGLSSLPPPTGQYRVGRRSFHWVDAQRHEPNGDRAS